MVWRRFAIYGGWALLAYQVVVGSLVHELTTVSDGICVTLTVDDPLNASTRLALEGSLRGIAARLVVALEYGG
jgi:hypothetical protein